MAKDVKTEDSERSVIELIEPGQKTKDLLHGVRKRHPKASKKEIVRAAFSALIKIADSDEGKAKALQSFALAERSGQND